MYPVALGSAIGLEKLAPLGAVTIGGLMIGTLMTLVFVPIVFIWTINEKKIREAYAKDQTRKYSSRSAQSIQDPSLATHLMVPRSCITSF